MLKKKINCWYVKRFLILLTHFYCNWMPRKDRCKANMPPIVNLVICVTVSCIDD